VFVLKKYAWGPLIAGLNKREQQVRQDLADAETARKKAEQMLADHERKLAGVQDEVREIIAEARRDADHTKQDIIATAQKEADASKNRAISEINRAKEAALKELFDTMAAQVADATEYVLGRSVTDQDQNRLINEALSQFSQGG
jgi:F-type H+-transporting ATPase subunit b